MLSVFFHASLMLLIINSYSQSYHDLQSLWLFNFYDIILDAILQLSIELCDEQYIFSLCFESYSLKLCCIGSCRFSLLKVH